MTKRLEKIIHSIASVLGNNKKVKTEEKPSAPLKLYTFFIEGEGIRKSVTIKAPDKCSAEHKVNEKYPDYKSKFLWELIRSPRE